MAQKDIVTKVEEYDLISQVSERPSRAHVAAEDVVSDSDSEHPFDLDAAWRELLAIPGCWPLYLDEKLQKEVGIEVGVNVTQEFAWKQVTVRAFMDSFQDDVPGWRDFRDNLKNIELDDLILIGYAPILTQNVEEPEEGDPFVAFSSHEAAKQAGSIIKNIETYERLMLAKQFIKRPKAWVSKGSEKEVDLMVPRKRKQKVDVEIQSVYPIRLTRSRFPSRSRTTNDVRDGYIELVPGDKKFENLFRRRVNIGIQSAPSKVSLEQQTDPTFPSNAWSQYLYEVSAADDGLDVAENEEKAPQSKAVTPAHTPVEETPPPPPDLSDQVSDLLKTLEFNKIDMYRNDYPVISSTKVDKYMAPYMEEIISFINIEKSLKRFVCGVDWFPTLSGLVVLSYSYSTLATSVRITEKVDAVTRAIVEPNPVLLWGFDDTLEFKLEFVSPREVTCLSFCPYDSNILVGGTINGQIILWDLQNRVANLDYEEILTQAQVKYRELMLGFLAWTKSVNEKITIQPTAVSVLETCQTAPITEIKWLNRKHYVSKTGKVYESKEPANRYFTSTSIDGSIAFWSLDSTVDSRKQSSTSRWKLPAQLVQNVSPFKKYDRVMKPEYMIAFPEPLTGIVYDVGKFSYEPQIPSKLSHDIDVRAPIVVTSVPQEVIRPKMFVGSFWGNVSSFDWEGFDFESGEAVNIEKIALPTYFAKVHDGYIFGILRNPHYEGIFASIGRYILAIWKEGFFMTPIFWRKRPCTLTSVQWSHDRPSVLFLSRFDGYVEAWDFLVRSDDPCLVEPLGGGIITAISEHRPIVPRKVLGIGDYNSSFRMILLPPSFQNPYPDEVERLKQIVEKEYTRKQGIKEWEKEWFEKNADVIQAKKMAEEQIALDLERIKREAEEEAARQAKIEAEEQRKAALKQTSKAIFDLPERLEQIWDDMLLRRYVDVLMERTRVDRFKLERQTALEKDRLQYEKEKKLALKKSLRKIDETVAAVRARLLPTEKDKTRRTSVVKDSIDEIMGDAATYEEVENECNMLIENFPEYDDMKYHDFLERGRLRRMILNQSLGGNTGRRHYYENLKETGKTHLLDVGVQNFNTSVTKEFSSITQDDLDEIPVRDEPEQEEKSQELELSTAASV